MSDGRRTIARRGSLGSIWSGEVKFSSAMTVAGERRVLKRRAVWATVSVSAEEFSAHARIMWLRRRLKRGAFLGRGEFHLGPRECQRRLNHPASTGSIVSRVDQRPGPVKFSLGARQGGVAQAGPVRGNGAHCSLDKVVEQVQTSASGRPGRTDRAWGSESGAFGEARRTVGALLVQSGEVRQQLIGDRLLARLTNISESDDAPSLVRKIRGRA